MPAIATLTVKKADGTTDIAFSGLSGSAGDNSPAYWRQDTGAAAAKPNGMRSSLQTSAAWNGPKTARRFMVKATFPYAVQDSTTTLYQSKDAVRFDGVFVLPVGIPGGDLNEAVHQICNLIAHQLTKDQAYAGYAAT